MIQIAVQIHNKHQLHIIENTIYFVSLELACSISPKVVVKVMPPLKDVGCVFFDCNFCIVAFIYINKSNAEQTQMCAPIDAILP